MKPILEELKKSVGDQFTILKIDIDKNRALAIHYGIQSVPTLIIFKEGKPIWRQSGVMQTQALKEILEKSPVETVGVENGGCPHFNICGGCSYISMPYEESLKIKENQVRELLEPVLSKQQSVCQIEPIRQSPVYYGYRNKMEFTFGDEVKDGPLALGMHKKGSFYDIVTVDGCRLVDDDYSAILRETLCYFEEKKTPFYHRYTHEGYLRHLLVRRASRTGEILAALVTTTQQEVDLESWKERLLSLPLNGNHRAG